AVDHVARHTEQRHQERRIDERRAAVWTLHRARIESRLHAVEAEGEEDGLRHAHPTTTAEPEGQRVDLLTTSNRDLVACVSRRKITDGQAVEAARRFVNLERCGSAR